MKRTWGYIKSECINLGFDKATAFQKNPSLFVESANRAMNIIATTVKPILAKYVITHNPLENLLPNPHSMMDLYSYPNNMPSAPLQASGVKAYYFECNGNGTATLTNGVDTTTIDMQSNGQFKPYKGFIDGDVTLTFSGDYGYMIRNMAMYGTLLGATEEDIQPFSQYLRYDIAELTKMDDETVFFDFADEEPIFQGSFSSGNSYKTVRDYKKDGRSSILLNRSERGQFEVWYKKFPNPVTDTTADDYELELDYDVCTLVPLLMGFYVWLDDDERKASMYRNDFEDRKNDILANMQPKQVASVVSTVRMWE